MEQRPHHPAPESPDGREDEEGSATGPPPAPGPFDALRLPTGAPAVELEPGWTATRALMRITCEELLAIMLWPSFRPVKELDLVPVLPCPHCRDGGLRTAGSIRTRRGREPVRACDTCATLEIGGHVATPRR
ncbi:MAG TPA: hypothetical protein VFY89_00260 [Ktedonobacterales bacterium]